MQDGIQVGKKGDKIEARFEGGSMWYAGRICKCHKKGTYDIQYDDGDREQKVDPIFIRRAPEINRGNELNNEATKNESKNIPDV